MKLMKNLIALALSAAMTVAATAGSLVNLAVVPDDNATSTGFNITDQDGDGVIRVACVGDSITAGTSDTNYPMYLQQYLNYLGSKNGKTYEVKNHGKGGAACRHVLEETEVDGDGDNNDYFYYDDNAYKSSLTYTPDVVIVQMGTNDALFDNWDNWDNYFNNDYYEYLVKPYQEKGAQVIMSTPPYACNGWHNENVNGPVHDKEVALASELGLKVVDTNRLMYGMDEVFADGLHCNATGYRMMAMNFYKLIFGGDPITATFKSEPLTTVRLTETTTGDQYIRTTDETGVATLDLLEGSSYSFSVIAEASGFRTLYDSISLSADKTFTFTLTDGGYNVALNGTAIDCGAAVYGENTSAGILDASRTSGGYQPNTWNEGDWCGVLLDDVHTVNMIVLSWETAAYISTYEDGGYNVYVMIDGEWSLVNPNSVSYLRAAYTGDIVLDTFQFEEEIDIEGVKIEFLNGTITDHKYAPKLFELEVYEWYVGPNLKVSTDREEYAVGSKVTLTMTNHEMSICSIAGGIIFDPTKLSCTSITASGLVSDSETVRFTCSSSVEAANESGIIGIAYASGEEASYESATVLTATFLVLAEGETDITVYESSDGTNGYSPKETKDTAVLSLTLSEGVLPTLLGDLDLDGTVVANDLTLLARHLGGVETITDATALANADLDSTEGVGAGDLTKLARVIARIEIL